jgi:hypothetical protein
MSRKDDGRTRPTRATREEEAREAHADHGVSEDSTAGPSADQPDEADDDVKEHYRDMTERGANTPGEGRLP